MKYIFVIDGLGGTGKSDMLEYIDKNHSYSGNISVITKFTTRNKRIEEINKKNKVDLKFIDEKSFEKYSQEPGFISYSFDEFKYGFHKKQLDESIIKNKFTFIIIRNLNIYNKIVSLYPNIKIVLIYIFSEKDKIIERLKEDKYTTEQIEFRLGRIEKHWENYIINSSKFDEIIINNGTKNEFKRQINDLIDYYSLEIKNRFIIDNIHKYTLLPELIGFKEKMYDKIKHIPFEKNVFLMMKYRPNNHHLYDIIKHILELNGYNCVRADDKNWQITTGTINPLAVLYCCKYGIALFDKPEKGFIYSPNVTYELAMMHYQKKECLILENDSIQNEEPFYVTNTIKSIYSDSSDFKMLIENWITKLK